MNRIYRTRR